NSRYSLVVTHLTTNLPVDGLCTGERTGPAVFHHLWSYVEVIRNFTNYKHLFEKYFQSCFQDHTVALNYISLHDVSKCFRPP
ncbi:hypothetical protein K441DRAFT_535988, partial [Cenococcum geophilum 1.58]